MANYTKQMTVDEEKGKDEDNEEETTSGDLSCISMFGAFYNAPKVTFITHTVSCVL